MFLSRRRYGNHDVFRLQRIARYGKRRSSEQVFGHKAVDVPIATGNNTVTRIDIEDVSLWPRM